MNKINVILFYFIKFEKINNFFQILEIPFLYVDVNVGD